MIRALKKTVFFFQRLGRRSMGVGEGNIDLGVGSLRRCSYSGGKKGVEVALLMSFDQLAAPVCFWP